jgi:hypothetical protein
MKTTAQRIVIGALLLIACPSSLLAQPASVNRNVPLHRDASTASPTIEHLPNGTRLMLVDAAAQGGFYHVRTEDEQVGWVWSKFVNVSQVPSVVGTVMHTHPNIPPPSDAQCDPNLWNHVYHHQRLIVIEQCASVTGTIVDATAGKQRDGVRHEQDGDTHGWLKVDPEFENLLNAGNKSAEGGNLVFEIVCKFPVTQPDAKAACTGYKDQIAIPPVGSHVRIVGPYVMTRFTRNGWRFIPLPALR